MGLQFYFVTRIIDADWLYPTNHFRNEKLVLKTISREITSKTTIRNGKNVNECDRDDLPIFVNV